MKRGLMGFRCSNASCGCDVPSPSGSCDVMCHDRSLVNPESGEACGCGHADCYQDSDWRLALEFEA